MNIAWTAPAIEDLERIQDYVATQRPLSAHRLVNRIYSQTVERLSDNPRIGRAGRVSGTRELVISGTAYLVVYRITQRIEVLSVIHGARQWPDAFP